MQTNSQSTEIQKIFDKILFGNIFYFAFCWFGIFVVATSEKKEASWSNGFVFLVIGIFIYITVNLLKRKIINSSFLHHIIFFASFFNALLIFDASLRLRVYIYTSLGNQSKLGLGVTILFVIFSIVIQVLYFQIKLREATKENIKSGRLNLLAGTWNLGFPIHFETKNIETQRYKRIEWLRRISPLFTAFTFIIARGIDGKMQSTAIALMVFVMGLIYILDYSRHLAIALQISEWEKANKVNIKLI